VSSGGVDGVSLKRMRVNSASISSGVQRRGRGSSLDVARLAVAGALDETIEPMIAPNFDRVTCAARDASNRSRQRSYAALDPTFTACRNAGNPTTHLYQTRNGNGREQPGGIASIGAGLLTISPASTSSRKYRVTCLTDTKNNAASVRRNCQNGFPLNDANRPNSNAALPLTPACNATLTAAAPNRPAGPSNRRASVVKSDLCVPGLTVDPPLIALPESIACLRLAFDS
jgi:hypothetical protein